MKRILNVLIVDGSKQDAAAVGDTLEAAGYKATYDHARGLDEAESLLDKHSYDVILLILAGEIDLQRFSRTAQEKEIAVILIGSPLAGTESSVEVGINGDHLIATTPSMLIASIKREIFCQDERNRRIKAERDLEEVEQRFRKWITLSTDAIAIQTAGRLVSINESGVKLLGAKKADELIGRPLLDLVHPDYHESVTERMRIIDDENKSLPVMEEKLLRMDGTYIDVEAASFPFDHHGRRMAQIFVRDISDRKRREEILRKQVERLAGLRAIDVAIAGEFGLQATLQVIIDQAINLLQVDASSILLLDPHTKLLEYAAGYGFQSDGLKQLRLGLRESYAGRAVSARQMMIIPDLRRATGEYTRTAELRNESFVAYIATPLIARGEVRGVMEIFHRRDLHPDQAWLDFLQTLAGQSAIAIDNATLFLTLQHTNAELAHSYDATLEGWVRALDLRDKETEGHTQRVTNMSLQLAEKMGFSTEELTPVRRGALLHDIGKLGIPDSILLKPGPLTEEEWRVMRRHPTYAYEWLSPIPHLSDSLDIPYAHHERWDGSGYPRGLIRESIPLAARIFAVVDVWDALCSDRPYRKGWPEEKVREHIKAGAGKEFDPEVVDSFFKMEMEA